MPDRFRKYDDDEVRNNVLSFEAARASGSNRHFDVDEMEIIIDYYLDQNDIEHLEDAVRYAEHLFPNATSIRLRRVHLLCAKGLYDRALPLLRELLRLEPDNTDIHYALGAVYSALGQPQTAIRHYLTASRDNYALDVIYGNIADEYSALQDDDQAIAYYKRALAINPKEQRSIQNLAYIYEYADRLNDGQQFFSDFVTQHPYSASAWYALARIYTNLSLFEKAIDAAEYAIAIDHKFFEAYLAVANCYVCLNDTGKATSTLLEAIPFTNSPEEVYHSIGIIYSDQNNFQTAIIYFQKAIAIDPYFGDALFSLSWCYAKLNDYPTAIIYIERAIAAVPNIAAYHFNAAHYYQNTNNIEEAEHHFNKALDLDPAPPDSYYIDFALFLFSLNQYRQTIKLLNQYLPNATDDLRALAILAACQFRLGDYQGFRLTASHFSNDPKEFNSLLSSLCPDALNSL